LYKIAGIILFIFFSGCSNNILSELADKDTDEALLFDARESVNAQDYDNAIAIITTQMSSGGSQKAEAREVLASAYAGKCGLNFIDFTDRLAQATSGTMFELVSSPFIQVEVDPASCLQSLQTLDLIGTTATRTNRQNSFAAVVGMVLMGSATRLYTDDVTPPGGDGTQDVVDISCGLSDAQIDNVILGYAYMAQNFSALSSSTIGGSSSTTIQDSIDTCNSIAGSACTNTDPAQITVQMRDTMKDLMNTTEYGVGDKDGSSPPAIAAACP
jgi:hypothetical protein